MGIHNLFYIKKNVVYLFKKMYYATTYFVITKFDLISQDLQTEFLLTFSNGYYLI